MTQTTPMESSLARAYCPFHQQQLENPYGFYAQARQQPIFATNTLLEDRLPVYVVTRYEDAHYILSHPELFSSKDTLHPVTAWSPEIFEILAQGVPQTPIHLNTDGAAHRRFRRPLSQAFLPARMAALEPSIWTHAHALLDQHEHACPGQPLDIVTDFAYPLTLDIILSLFHLPEEDRAQAKRWCDQWLSLVSAPLSREEQREAAHGVVAFQHYLELIIKQRSAAPLTNDLISDLVHAEKHHDVFSHAEIVNILGGVLLAGHETSTNMIGNGIVYLLSHQEHWQALCVKPDMASRYVEELLRIDTPAHTFFRTTTTEVTLGSVTIPANTLLLLVFGSVNRDEQVFSQPDMFLPDRVEKHMAFGRGAHFCLGASLARLEGEAALTILSQRYPHLALVSEQSLNIQKNLMFRGYQHVLVTY